MAVSIQLQVVQSDVWKEEETRSRWVSEVDVRKKKERSLLRVEDCRRVLAAVVSLHFTSLHFVDHANLGLSEG